MRLLCFCRKKKFIRIFRTTKSISLSFWRTLSNLARGKNCVYEAYTKKRVEHVLCWQGKESLFCSFTNTSTWRGTNKAKSKHKSSFCRGNNGGGDGAADDDDCSNEWMATNTIIHCIQKFVHKEKSWVRTRSKELDVYFFLLCRKWDLLIFPPETKRVGFFISIHFWCRIYISHGNQYILLSFAIGPNENSMCF